MISLEVNNKYSMFKNKVFVYIIIICFLLLLHSLYETNVIIFNLTLFKLDLFNLFFEIDFNFDYGLNLSKLGLYSQIISRAIVDGLAFSMLLFLMVSGFYIIFGLADVINFAHGAFFMLGGFIGYEIYISMENLLGTIDFLGSNTFLLSLIAFILTMLCTVIILGFLGGVIEITTIRRLYGKPLAQILLTVGFSFIIIEIVDIIWGPASSVYSINTTTFFISGVIEITENLRFALYRIFIIFLGFFVAIIMYLVFSRTRIGLLVQAAIEDAEMVEALGTNVKRMLTLVFITGVALAGLAGFILVPWLGANQANATTYLLYAFVIVVVGGAHYGKFEGTFFGSLIVGLAFKYTEIFTPDLSSIITFLIMALVLIFKPGGLTGEA